MPQVVSGGVTFDAFPLFPARDNFLTLIDLTMPYRIDTIATTHWDTGVGSQVLLEISDVALNHSIAFSFNVDSGTISITVADDGVTKGVVHLIPYVNDTAVTYGIRFNGTQYECYIDGVLKLTTVGANPAHAVGPTLSLLTYVDGSPATVLVGTITLIQP